MVECKDDHVIKFYTSFVNDNELWLVMQLMDSGRTAALGVCVKLLTFMQDPAWTS